MAERNVEIVLDPTDEYPHEPDPVPNYNESMYFNAFDLEQEVGGWFRIGNRVNEGYAEVSICIYLPGGRVGFMFGRPAITTNAEMNAGGLKIEVIEPFVHLRLTYEGSVCLLDDPHEMADPRTAFAENPNVACSVALDVRGISPMWGGRAVYDDGSPVEIDAERSFAKAHYEQHTAVTGSITVGDEGFAIDGLGLRDKSWGPRHWQAIAWYRWLPMVFGPDFAMMLSVQGRGQTGDDIRRTGVVLEDGEYHRITDVTIESDWDEHHYQTAMRCTATAENGKEYEVTGEAISLIPLRNRRTTPDGEKLFTRITEAMTRFECGGRTGLGMSEYLDQIVDGRPVGSDVT